MNKRNKQSPPRRLPPDEHRWQRAIVDESNEVRLAGDLLHGGLRRCRRGADGGGGVVEVAPTWWRRRWRRGGGEG
jgi:hypothetical protein